MQSWSLRPAFFYLGGEPVAVTPCDIDKREGRLTMAHKMWLHGYNFVVRVFVYLLVTARCAMKLLCCLILIGSVSLQPATGKIIIIEPIQS